MWKLTEDISNWAVRFFSKFINTFSYLQENSETPTLKIRSLMITFKRFHSFIVQSSPRLKEKVITSVLNFQFPSIWRSLQSFSKRMKQNYPIHT